MPLTVREFFNRKANPLDFAICNLASNLEIYIYISTNIALPLPLKYCNINKTAVSDHSMHVTPRIKSGDVY
jgi:hypothetical protein